MSVLGRIMFRIVNMSVQKVEDSQIRLVKDNSYAQAQVGEIACLGATRTSPSNTLIQIPRWLQKAMIYVHATVLMNLRLAKIVTLTCPITTVMQDEIHKAVRNQTMTQNDLDVFIMRILMKLEVVYATKVGIM